MLTIYDRREQDKIDKSIFEVHPFLCAWLRGEGCEAEGSLSMP
jgi:hypothetical protein